MGKLEPLSNEMLQIPSILELQQLVQAIIWELAVPNFNSEKEQRFIQMLQFAQNYIPACEKLCLVTGDSEHEHVFPSIRKCLSACDNILRNTTLTRAFRDPLLNIWLSLELCTCMFKEKRFTSVQPIGANSIWKMECEASNRHVVVKRIDNQLTRAVVANEVYHTKYVAYTL